MIYTITLNPALDREITVDEVRFDDANRVKEEHHYAGGKGIDVSRVIRELGGQSVALGFVAGFAGLEFQGLLINEGVTCDFVEVPGETRTNVMVYDEKNKRQVNFNARGPQVRPQDVAQFYNKVKRLTPAPTFVHMGGSLPPGITANIYGQLVKHFRDQDVPVAVDADREPMRLALAAEPTLIKPNRHELRRLLGKEFTRVEDVASAAQELLQRGVEMVMVTMGPDGLVVCAEGEKFHAQPPVVEARSTIGSGDSSLAAFMLGLSRGEKLSECARLAAAAGAATALTPGTELCHREDVERFTSMVKVRTL